MTSPESIVAPCVCGKKDCRIAFGECHCGCKMKTEINNASRIKFGTVKGTPRRFISQHHAIQHPEIESAKPFKINQKPCRLVPLSRGQYSIVDESIYVDVMRWRWTAHWCSDTGTYYALRKGRNAEGKVEQIWMHRYVLGLMGWADSTQGDHKDTANTLDNRTDNLRRASAAQNSQNRGKRIDNTSGYKGVTWHKRINKWHAQITANKITYHLGYFDDKEEAYNVYCEAAFRLHGEFARIA